MKQKNIIVVIRHGESDYNVDGIIQGQSDFSKLTNYGIKQAESIGSALQGLSIDDFYTSPLRRAYETSKIIATNFGYDLDEIRHEDCLVEIDFCSWTGQKRNDIINNDGTRYSSWRKRPYDLCFDNKYPVRDLYSRIHSFVKMLKSPTENRKTILVVCHKGTASALIVSLLNLPISHHHCMMIDRGSINVMQERNSTEENIEYEMVCSNKRPYINSTCQDDFLIEDRTPSYGEIFLVRHGQTVANIEREYQGSKDTELSRIGIRSMQSLSRLFYSKKPVRIVSSPLLRAKQSAKILSSVMNIPSVTERKELHEFIYGVWEGMTEKNVQNFRSEEYNRWKTSPVNAKIPDAEHINDAYNRCGNVFDSYIDDILSWGGTIISVAHDIVNRLLICNAIDLPPNFIWCFKQINSSVTILGIKKTYDGRLKMLNHTPYSLARILSDEWL